MGIIGSNPGWPSRCDEPVNRQKRSATIPHDFVKRHLAGARNFRQLRRGHEK
jgi:hypothetical protein